MEDNYVKRPVPSQEDDGSKYPADAIPTTPVVRKRKSGLLIALSLLCLALLAVVGFLIWRQSQMVNLNDLHGTTVISLPRAIPSDQKELHETIIKLEAENAALQQALDAATVQLTGTQAALSENQELLSEAQAALIASEAQRADTEAEFSEVKAALDEATTQLTDTQAALSSKQDQLAAAQAALAATEAELADTQANLDSTQAALASSEAQLTATESELAASVAQLAATESVLNDTMAALEEATARLHSLE